MVMLIGDGHLCTSGGNRAGGTGKIASQLVAVMAST